MKKCAFVVAAAGLMTLAACNSNPAADAVENNADVVADNLEMQADNMDAMADDASNVAVADTLENAADNATAAADNVRDSADAVSDNLQYADWASACLLIEKMASPDGGPLFCCLRSYADWPHTGIPQCAAGMRLAPGKSVSVRLDLGGRRHI